ncbi:MAG: glycosyltransferase family 2 protein [Candidatus Doudnabacteria bacterium]|nr:glycosyltransferase family 2 protein [Candidatus Doudnabacteria bacterium]
MISFIIPARNEQLYIADCIESILKQGLKNPFEIVVVDNASTDGTAAVVKKKFPNVILLREEKLGTNQARQKGFLHSGGEVLIFLDSDVRLPAGWLEKVLKKSNSDPGIVAISAPYHFYDFPAYLQLANIMYVYLVSTPWQFFIRNIARHSSFMIGGNMVIKRWALKKIEGFDTKFRFFGDDTDTGIRLGTVGKVVFSPRFWVYTSARRFNQRGVFRTMFTYLLNYTFVLFTKSPFQKTVAEYEEIR